MPTTSGAASAILAHQNRSSTNERPLCMLPLSTTLQHSSSRFTLSLTVTHVWVGDRAHGAGMLGTDAGDNAEELTDGFRARPAIERSIHYHSSARLGAAGRTGTNAESQRFTMVVCNSRHRWRHLITSSDSMRLNDQP